jgi:pimeloyl-ACP methyl ester carboxylesterase
MSILASARRQSPVEQQATDIFYTRARMRTVVSRDGTRIGFEKLGHGPPVVIVSGMLCDRRSTQDLAERLAHQFSVVHYDRRGRGESGDTPPYAVAREIEDLAALLAELGGSAAVYGHSSGAGLALRAAAAGLPVTRLVLHEAPYGPADEESMRGARELAERVRAANAQDRRADAIRQFLAAAGMPPALAEKMAGDAALLAMAPTMIYDFEVMDEFGGGTIPEDLVRSIGIPTLVIAGGESPDFFRDTAARIAALLPDANHAVLAGQDHGAPADAVVPVVAEFLLHASPAGGSA